MPIAVSCVWQSYYLKENGLYFSFIRSSINILAHLTFNALRHTEITIEYNYGD